MIFGKTEQTINQLRELYKHYGYKKYKMSRFETYDFYLDNRDFLLSEHVITFTDTRGKLMALKPDVTLSIVKNAAGEKNKQQKYFYNENVFRMIDSTHEFKEIMQVGLEYIGHVDLYATCEVLMLAQKSLQVIGLNSILDVSHMGLVSGILKATGLSYASQKQMLKYIGQKNVHEIRALCTAEGLTEETDLLLEKLATLYGPFAKVLPQVKKMAITSCAKQAIIELEQIYQMLQIIGLADQVNLDFSITNDMRYYNGIIFQGYVQGIPKSILSGGRYDKLLHKFGKNNKMGAIGFAIYTDLLDSYEVSSKQYDADIIICYDREASIPTLLQLVQQYADQGLTVWAQQGEDQEICAKKVLKLTKEGLMNIGSND